MTATFNATCVCGQTSEPQSVSLENGWSLMALAADLAAEGWGHDEHGRRLCPDCREAAGVPYNPGYELPPRPEECLALEGGSTPARAPAGIPSSPLPHPGVRP